MKMTTFRLKSRTNVFTLTRRYRMLDGTLECVEGVTEISGRLYKTNARLVDVINLS